MTDARYTGVDAGATREARDQMVDQTWWKPKSGQGTRWGDNLIRVMPPHPSLGKKLFWGVPLHFSIGPNQIRMPCPRRAFQGQSCPVCVAGFKLKDEGQEEAGNDLLPTWLGYMCVVEIDEKGQPVGDNPKVKIWSASGGIIDDLIDIIENPEFGDFTDLEKGFDINVRKRGSGKKGTKYQTTAKTKASKFPMPELAEGVIDLSQLNPFVKNHQEVMLAAMEGSPAADPMLPQATAAAEGQAEELPEATPESSDEGGFPPPPPDEEEEPANTPSEEKRTAAQKALVKNLKEDESKEE